LISSTIKDRTRNTVSFDGAGLQALGFPTTLDVIKPSLITDGTVGQNGGQVSDQTFGERATVFFPAGALSWSDRSRDRRALPTTRCAKTHGIQRPRVIVREHSPHTSTQLSAWTAGADRRPAAHEPYDQRHIAQTFQGRSGDRGLIQPLACSGKTYQDS
jgi:hypothetical protein